MLRLYNGEFSDSEYLHKEIYPILKWQGYQDIMMFVLLLFVPLLLYCLVYKLHKFKFKIKNEFSEDKKVLKHFTISLN